MRSPKMVLASILLLFWVAAGSAQTADKGTRNGVAPSGELQILDGGTCGTPTVISAVPYNDSGTTVGKTSTVNTVGTGSGCGTILHAGQVGGPDTVYKFTVGPGNNLTFTVTPTGAGTIYDVDIYALSVCGDGTTCVGGSDTGGDGQPETLVLSGLAPGSYYLYIDSFYIVDVNRRQGTYTLSVTGTLGSLPQNFFSLTPCRIVDTRGSVGPYGGPALAANADRSFVLKGQCGIPATATAVSINVTVTQPTAQGDLRIVPGGSALPVVSTINYRPGQTRANNMSVGLGAAGDITVHTDQATGTVHFILDVDGYYQ